MTTTTPHPQGAGPVTGPPLRRCRHRGLIAGVAAGLADWLGADVTVVRLALVVLAAFGGVAVPLYAAAWLLIPAEGAERSVAEDLVAQVSAWIA